MVAPMDTSRLGTGEMIAAAGAVALFILMFLPWYGVDAEFAGVSVSDSANAWESMSVIDILLFLLALATVGIVAGRAAGSVPDDSPWAMLLVAAGGLALLLMLYRVIDIPTGDVPSEVEDAVDFGRKIGIFLALVAAAAMAYGGWRANAERPTAPGGPPPAPAA
jgi:hypothetical protein